MSLEVELCGTSTSTVLSANYSRHEATQLAEISSLKAKSAPQRLPSHSIGAGRCPPVRLHVGWLATRREGADSGPGCPDAVSSARRPHRARPAALGSAGAGCCGASRGRPGHSQAGQRSAGTHSACCCRCWRLATGSQKVSLHTVPCIFTPGAVPEAARACLCPVSPNFSLHLCNCVTIQ